MKVEPENIVCDMNSTDTRHRRQQEICNIINSMPVKSQTELARILQTRGFDVTQASLSRDLKAVNARKYPRGNANARYIIFEEPDLERMGEMTGASASVLSFSLSGNMAVIKTRNGYAGGLAYDIDMLDSPLILGTIAGADTIFAVLHADASRAEILDVFAEILPDRVLQEYF